MIRKITFLTFLVFAFVYARAGYTPVTVTSYNADVVANGIGAASASTTNDVDGGNYVFISSNFQQTASSSLPTQSLPATGLINSVNTSGLSFQLASYSANNSLRIASGTDSLVFGTQTAAGEVYVLATGGGSSAVVTYTVNFTDNTSQTFSSITIPDWYGGTGYAVTNVGRALRTTGALETGTTGPRLYESKLTLSSSNYSKLIRSITVQKTSGAGIVNVMGVSINTVCTGGSGGTAISSSASVCPTIAYSLSLNNSTSGIGSTFQWQSNTGSGWTNISGATNSGYTASAGQAVVTSYRVYTSCLGGSADTSTSVSVGLNPIDQCYCIPVSPAASTYISNFTTTGGAQNVNKTSGAGVTSIGYSNYTGSDTIGAMQTATVNVSSIFVGGTAGGKILVDWNQNGIFTDAGETVYTTSTYVDDFTGSFTVPATALPGITRLRVINDWLSTTAAYAPCGFNSGGRGEAEDYTFKVYPLVACAIPSQPTGLVLSPASSIINGSFTAASPAADRYLVVRTQGAALNTAPVNGTTYSPGNTLGNGVVVAYGAGTTFTDAGLSVNTSYTYTVFAANIGIVCSTTYNTTAPLIATVSTSPVNTYTWNVTSGSADWTVASNWTPARTIPDPLDMLQFTSGGNSIATNIPTQTVQRITFGNNTTTNFQSGAASTLTINSDNNAATKELDIQQGSSLISNGTTAALTIKFAGTGGTGRIAGTLEIANTGAANGINFTNAIDTVTATGTFALGGNAAVALTSSATTLVVFGTYNHKYTTVAGTIPTATWASGSNVQILGYTTATAAPSGIGQTFSNFTYNCTAQTVTGAWGGSVPTNVADTLKVLSTGTGTWGWSATTSYTANIKNYFQSGGIVDFGTGASGAKQLNITGTLNQSGGTFKTTGTSTGVLTIKFNGTAAQTATFLDAAPVGQIVYQVANPAGLNLVGTGNLTTTPTFNINSGGGVRISVTNASPINTTLALSYAATGSTLTYDTTGSWTANSTIWPATNSPANVTVNTGSTFNVLTVPFSRTISGTLTMTSGDINLGANTLTLGTGSTSVGTLTYTAGSIRLTTGSLVRWYGTSGLPTSAGTGIGYYPVSYGTMNRNVSVYFSTATALSSAGTIAVSHANVPGLQTGLSVADGTYTINARTNSSWAFTAANGIAASGTLGLKLTGTGLLTSNTPANLRVMQANAVAGTHAAGAGTSAIRTGLAISDLSVPYYIGASSADIGGLYVAINTGNWSNPSTWDINLVPTNVNDAIINSGVTVTVDQPTNAARSLNIFTGGTLLVNSNTLTLDSALTNNGTVNVGGGTLTVNINTTAADISGITNNTGSAFNLTSGTVNLGPAGGGNKQFNATDGTTTVSGGNLKINGALKITGGTFNQTGGAIIIDGNSGTASSSVATGGTGLCYITSTPTVSMTGGTLTFVDPYHSSYTTGSGTNPALNISSSVSKVTFGGTHTVICGDGISTTPGNSDGFVLETWSSSRTPINNLIVNGGSTTGRWTTASNNNSSIYGFHMKGDLTINAGSEMRSGTTAANAGEFFVGGNIINNGTLTLLGTTLSLGSVGTVYVTTTPQTISGTGVFQNNTTGSTANFRGITVFNSGGVTFNIGNTSFSGAVTFSAGANGPSVIKMANNSILSEIAGASASGYSQTNGWVNGRYQKAAGVGTITHTYPVGDSLYFTRVDLNSTSGAVTTAGAIVVGTTTLDHPNINSSNIKPAKSVNRYYTIAPANGIVVTPASLSAKLAWNTADIDAGANTAIFKAGKYSGTAWSTPTVTLPTANNITVTGLDLAQSAAYQIGEYCAPINITAQPANQSICLGSPITLGFTLADTAAVTFQWRKNGVNIAGATNYTYTIPTTTLADSGNYSVALGSACTSVTAVVTNTAKLSVNVPVAITTQPATQTICENSPVTFTVGATGTGITYQWKYNGNNITGATNASYTIPSVATTDAGSYSVVVLGAAPCGNVTSSVASLTVNPLPLAVTASGTTTFCAGGSVVLSAPAAPATLAYQWNQNGASIPNATSANYTATAFGNYTVTITNTANNCTNTSAAIAVTNGTPVSTITPAIAASFCSGNSLTLTGPNAGGVTYQWYLNGSAINGATNQTYAATLPGNYTLAVSSGPTCSGFSAPTLLTMNPLPTAQITPAGPTTFCAGGSVALNANVGTNLAYQWYKNGTLVSGATSASYTANATGSYTVSVTNSGTGCNQTSAPVAVTVNTLPAATITPATATTFCAGGSVVLNANTGTGLTYSWQLAGAPNGATNSSYTANASGSYTVKVTNANNCSATSATQVVTVNPLPNVTVTVGGPTTFCAGGSVTLNVPAGTNQTYQWKNNGTNVSGATNNSYAATATGSYTVVVTNTATTCNATSTATTVTVNPVPVATTTPTSAPSLCQGDSVVLTANTGTGITYQWNTNGNPINGATNGQYVAITTGNYTVTTTNSFNCSATSAAVPVTVNPVPASTVTYNSPIEFCQGGAVVLSGTPGAGYSYQWYSDGNPVSLANSADQIFSTTGAITLKVTNGFNCSSISQPVMISVHPLPNPVVTRNGFTLSTTPYLSYQWYFNSQPIAGANARQYSTTQNGAYYVSVTDSNHCYNLSSVEFINNIGVGVANVPGKVEGLKIYPNPTHQYVNIDAPVKVDVIIRDLQGRNILTQKDAKQIDLGQVADGVYMMLILDQDGKLIQTERLFKSE